MRSINFKKEVSGTVEGIVQRVTDGLKTEGFGVLTRIDFHSKMKEKLNKDMPPTIILGACSPALAYQAFNKNSDVASLLPCNVVVRDAGAGMVRVEMAKPSAMMEILGDSELVALSKDADAALARVLEAL